MNYITYKNSEGKPKLQQYNLFLHLSQDSTYKHIIYIKTRPKNGLLREVNPISGVYLYSMVAHNLKGGKNQNLFLKEKVQRKWTNELVGASSSQSILGLIISFQCSTFEY